MRTKAKSKSNKFMRIVTIPVRALSKARDMYVKSMTRYANNVGGTNFMAIPGDGRMMPRSFSATSATRSDDGDDFRELIRAASARSYGHRNELDMYLKELVGQQQQKASKGLPKNKSVRSAGMGMMIIEEEGEENKEGSSRL